MNRLARILILVFVLAQNIALAEEHSLLHEPPEFQIPESQRLKDIIALLARSDTGKALIGNAMKVWHSTNETQFLSHLRFGKVSRTDSVLTRKLDSETGVEMRDRIVTLFLRSGQSQKDLVLDLAHEMTHAVTLPSWDPYDPKLTVGDYVISAIEGAGSETEAIMTECVVAQELGFTDGHSDRKCERYKNEDGLLSREKIKSDLYRVGDQKTLIEDKLGAEKTRLPLLSEEKPELFSSTGNAPYPLSLIFEFEQLTASACENSKRRLAALDDSDSKSTRESRSVSADRLNSTLAAPESTNQRIKLSTHLFIEMRCKR